MAFTIKDVLRAEIAPALGCTDPVAIALGAAAAASILPARDIDGIEIWVDPNIFKNGLAVTIPGTGGLSGLDTAAALGALGGDAARSLEVLAPIDQDVVAKAGDLVRDGRVKVHLMSDHQGILIKTRLTSGPLQAESVIRDFHDRLESLTLDGQAIHDHPLLAGAAVGPGAAADRVESWLQGLTLPELTGLIDDLDAEDLEFLEQGAEYNLRLAEYGLEHGPGLGIGRSLQKLADQKMLAMDMSLAARMLTAAAADARMGGVKLPAMASAGSGNHGLTAVLPLWAVKDYVDCDRQRVLEGIGLSHLLTAYVKAHTGRLSAVCGCTIAAGAGAAAGITHLLGGDVGRVSGAVKNLIEDLAGVICDGAKAGCALKLATAAASAVEAALFSMRGVVVHAGIIGDTMEQTTRNIGALSTEGMIDADRTILGIMLHQRFSD